MEKLSNEREKQRLQEERLIDIKNRLLGRQELKKLKEAEKLKNLNLKSLLVRELNDKCLKEHQKHLSAIKIQKIAKG